MLVYRHHKTTRDYKHIILIDCICREWKQEACS